MKILLNDREVEFWSLTRIHDDICVCWDRDGIDDIVSQTIDLYEYATKRLMPDVNTLRVWTATTEKYATAGGHRHPAALLVGNTVPGGLSPLLCAYFVLDPVAHWRAPIKGLEVAW